MTISVILFSCRPPPTVSAQQMVICRRRRTDHIPPRGEERRGKIIPLLPFFYWKEELAEL